MKDDEYLEFQFVFTTLKKFGYRIHSLFIKEIEGKKLVKTGDLRSGISFELKRAGKVGGELLFNFPDYGRFIEIHFFKRNENQITAFSNKNRAVFSEKSNRAKSGRGRKKDTRWYAKTAYGNLNPLIGELMYGFTDAVRAQMFATLIQPYKS